MKAKNMILKTVSYLLVAVAASAATLALFPENGQSKLEELSSLIEEKFVGESDRTRMEDAAAAAMVDSLGDEWSYYISAADYEAYQNQMNNAYVGVGITIQLLEDDRLQIVDIVPGGPAQKAGMQVGDILWKAEGRDCTELGIDGAGDVIRGPEHTSVNIVVLREGEEIAFDVTREFFEIPVAEGHMIDGNVAYVRIENFDSRCAEETLAILKDLVDQGAEAVLFDVRSNPGGYVTELCKVLDYLLPEGDLFRSEYYDGTVQQETSDKDFLDLPMAVLVNEQSYSAAEFFAAAISEYGAGFLVGEKTYGKGYFQQTYRLNDGSAVGLSVGRYFTPQGRNLAGVGLVPDVEVPVDEETAMKIAAGLLEDREDPQIQAALERLKAGKDLDG